MTEYLVGAFAGWLIGVLTRSLVSGDLRIHLRPKMGE